MNLSANSVSQPAGAVAVSGSRRGLGIALTIAAMPVYSLVTFANLGEQAGVVTLLATRTVSYVLAVALYFGIARLAFERHTGLLWTSVLGGVIVAFLAAGPPGLWAILTGWGMLLLAGAATGRLTRAACRPSQVYLLGVSIVAVFFTMQSLLVWREFASLAPQAAESFAIQWEGFLTGLGYGPDVIRSYLDQARQVFDLFVRLFPAATVLGALMQFSIGYVYFVRWANRREPSLACHVAFKSWRVPFGVATLLLSAVAARMLGGETLRLVADNLLLVLAVYYGIAGLALTEYLMIRLHVSALMKALFYLLLFLTQLVGFVGVALLGFVDSFFNLRTVRLQDSV
ncbi:MAG TPA: DUF2232 domain-containing protein [Candidatus Deferrimicrobium sp.]|nr:DUF2232 domain-containing protein [Candidatus Deferrimicrobium sp.]